MKRKILFIFAVLVLFSVSVSAQNQAIVISKTAQLKEKPSKTAKVIFTIKKGAKLTLELTEHKNGWYNVSVLNGNQKGWVHGNDIKIELDEKALWKEVAEILRPKDEWTPVATSRKQSFLMHFYFNPAKVSKSGALTRFWIKLIPSDKTAFLKDIFDNELKVPMPSTLDPKEFMYELSYYEANCEARLLRRVRYYNYWEDGTVDDNSTYVDKLEPVIPDSIGETFFEKACAVK